LSAFISRSQCTLQELRIDRSSGMLSESIYREALPSIATIVLEP
jgi:cell division inhibitor SulA